MKRVNSLRGRAKDEIRRDVNAGSVNHKGIRGDASVKKVQRIIWTKTIRFKARHTRDRISYLVEGPHTESVHNPTQDVVQDRPLQVVIFFKVNIKIVLCYTCKMARRLIAWLPHRRFE